MAALWRMDIGQKEMTVHGFRPDFIEHQLAHAVRDPNGRTYNRTAFLPERRVMMQAWADYYLDRLRAGGKIEPWDSRTGAFRHPGDRNTASRLVVPGS